MGLEHVTIFFSFISINNLSLKFKDNILIFFFFYSYLIIIKSEYLIVRTWKQVWRVAVFCFWRIFGLCVSCLCVLSFRLQVKFEKGIPENSYCSAMQWAIGLKFYCVIADPKVDENKILLTAIVFKLQVILLIIILTEKSESSYYSLSYWDTLPSYSPSCSYGKSSWTICFNKLI